MKYQQQVHRKEHISVNLYKRKMTDRVVSYWRSAKTKVKRLRYDFRYDSKWREVKSDVNRPFTGNASCVNHEIKPRLHQRHERANRNKTSLFTNDAGARSAQENRSSFTLKSTIPMSGSGSERSSNSSPTIWLIEPVDQIRILPHRKLHNWAKIKKQNFCKRCGPSEHH